MNGQPTVNHSAGSNEQLIGKFHVVNVDKLPTNPIVNHEEPTAIAGQQQQQLPATAAAPPPSNADESACPSRFQMIRVDRNFVRGRWKVNDYEPPENIATATNPPVNHAIENEPVNISNAPTSSAIPTTIAAVPTTTTTVPSTAPPVVHGDSNVTSSAALAATAASAAAAAATAFQQQQQRLAMNNPATIVPPTNVAPPAGLLPGYPPTALPNMPPPNQSYILPPHPQFGYYQFFMPPYAPYAAQWAALPTANSYLPPPMPPPQQQTSQLPTGNLGDPIRLTDAATDITSENPVISSTLFSNPTTDHLQNAQIGAPPGSFMYAAQHPLSAYMSQPPPANASSYANATAYPSAAQPTTIIPPTARPSTLAQNVSNIAESQQQSLSAQSQQQQQPQAQSYSIPTSVQQPQQQQQQPAPVLTSPKHDTSAKIAAQPSMIPKGPTAATTVPAKAQTTVVNTVHPDLSKTTTAPINLPRPVAVSGHTFNADGLRTATNPTYVTDLLSTSPLSINVQQPTQSLIQPVTMQTANPSNLHSPHKAPTTPLNNIWPYPPAGTPLNLSQTAAQTAAVTAVAAMGLLNNDTGQNAEITNEILKELTTPTKQNNITDIDNKISAAMDLVKLHLLSAVREEVTELRQQIQTLTDKVNSVEQENAFLRQHVPSEILAQYIPSHIALSSANDLPNYLMTVTIAPSSAPVSSIITSSQPISTASVSSLPSASLAQQPTLSTTSQLQQPPPPPLTNLPAT